MSLEGERDARGNFTRRCAHLRRHVGHECDTRRVVATGSGEEITSIFRQMNSQSVLKSPRSSGFLRYEEGLSSFLRGVLGQKINKKKKKMYERQKCLDTELTMRIITCQISDIFTTRSYRFRVIRLYQISFNGDRCTDVDTRLLRIFGFFFFST